MPNTQNSNDIDAIVNLLPTFAEAATHAVGRGNCHTNENEKGGETDRDEGSFENVLLDGGEQQALVENQPGQEVHQDVEEREQAEHAAKTYEPVFTSDAP